jgi:hypothetical protein
MLKEFFKLLKAIYCDFEFELSSRESIILNHGHFIECFENDKDSFLVYRLDKKYKYRFAVVHFVDNQKITQILLLDNLDVDQFLPAEILQTALDYHLR